MEEKITIKEIAPYFPFGIRFGYSDPNMKYSLKLETLSSSKLHSLRNKKMKPLLVTIDDFIKNGNFTKEILEDIILFSKEPVLSNLSFLAFRVFCQNKVDMYNLIKKGLAIDAKKTYIQDV